MVADLDSCKIAFERGKFVDNDLGQGIVDVVLLREIRMGFGLIEEDRFG